jgi:hypothetical protein
MIAVGPQARVAKLSRIVEILGPESPATRSGGSFLVAAGGPRKEISPMFIFDPMYFLWIAPAMALAFWAQWKVKAAFTAAAREPAPLTGAAAARHILDAAGATSRSSRSPAP